jgi:hypothetical protein
MFNELERLRDTAELFSLLSHYGELAAPDRHAWQDRCMRQDACTARDITRLHGELIAYGWVEQNTGVAAILRADEAPGCYRITPAGLRALKQVKAGEVD